MARVWASLLRSGLDSPCVSRSPGSFEGERDSRRIGQLARDTPDEATRLRNNPQGATLKPSSDTFDETTLSSSGAAPPPSVLALRGGDAVFTRPRSPAPPRLVAAGLTDVGRSRERNEDSFACRPELGLFLVADGMGGEAGGDLASRLAIASMCEAVEGSALSWPEVAVGESGDARALLDAAIHFANARILATAASEPTLRNMGTTIAAVIARGDRATIAHVGDSRVYRLRRSAMELLTEDHSLAAASVRSGRLSPRVASRSAFRHVLTRALGALPNVDVATRVEDAEPGDVLLLCSDGLSGVVADRDIAAIIAAHQELGEAARSLVERANAAGGPDNITCVLARWPS